MAKPVKETPILRGDDARAFERAIVANEKKQVSPEELKRIEAAKIRFKMIEPGRRG